MWAQTSATMCKLIFFQFVRFCSSEQFWSFPKQTKLCKIPRNYKSPRTWYPVLDAQRQGCVLGASIRSREPKSDTDGEETGDHSSYGLHPLKHDSHTPSGRAHGYRWVFLGGYEQLRTGMDSPTHCTHSYPSGGRWWMDKLVWSCKESPFANKQHVDPLAYSHDETETVPQSLLETGEENWMDVKVSHSVTLFDRGLCGCVERDENTWHRRTSTPDRVCAQRDMPRGWIVQTLVETSLDLGWVVMCVALIGPELGWGLIRSSPWQGQNSDLKDHFQGSGPNGGTDATSSEILLQKAPQTSVFSRWLLVSCFTCNNTKVEKNSPLTHKHTHNTNRGGVVGAPRWNRPTTLPMYVSCFWEEGGAINVFSQIKVSFGHWWQSGSSTVVQVSKQGSKETNALKNQTFPKHHCPETHLHFKPWNSES